MPTDPVKPPDPILEEFCTLTGMEAEGLQHKPCDAFDGSNLSRSRSRGRPKGVKNRPKGIKVQSPGSSSAGAGAILKRLRNAKVNGKGRSRSESSPIDGCGKRPNSCSSPINDALSKVLDRIAVGRQMVFREGCNDKISVGCNVSKSNSDCVVSGNDGSFINKPIVTSKSEEIMNDARVESNGSVDSVCVDPCSVRNSVSKLNVAGGEHMEVEATRKASKDGLGVDKVDTEFVFGKGNSNKGILNKPPVGLTRVQFGPSLFFKPNVWSSNKSGVKSDGSLNIESFAEKMKKGVEDRELKMNFSPQCVGIGRPMLMDKLTKERCLKKAGKLDFARVLVEVSAVDELPHSIEIEYPPIGERPAKVGKLLVKYQWQPPQCTHCQTFGHSTVSCKVRPRTEAETAAVENRKAMVGKGVSDVLNPGVKTDGEGFMTVGKNNKPVGNLIEEQSYKQKQVVNNRSFQNRNSYGSTRFSNGNARQNSNNGSSFQQERYGNSRMQNSWKAKGANVNVSQEKQGLKGKNSKANVNVNNPVTKSSKDEGLVHKPPLSTKFNENFKPKVLVRGSGSASNAAKIISEDIPVSNSFDALKDQVMVDKEDEFIEGMDEEYINVVWPKLKSEVEEVMKSGVYPSLEVKSNWSLSQLDYFFKNCAKFGMEPYVDDEDVESENEGMADVMKPENIDAGGPVAEKCGPTSNQGLNES
ncbi:hypothetical protein CTI12_AA472210 [Artemisia annua]|uniref:DUF4283 domain-containing protein n=1 Tax=Artemisia annua TaxID=35608 RepID=A0A2U1LLH6_ARTAN|nr:hypothetical protein CTI12_AA472210 [Artemisia annua]